MKNKLLLLCLLLAASLSIYAKDKETKIAPGVWFEGAVNAEGLPTGHGTSIVANAAKVKKATQTETITGDFEGNVVKNAELRSTDLLYGGDLQWNFLPEENNLSVIDYDLSAPDFKKIDDEKLKALAGTYTADDETSTGDQKLWYTVNLKADGTCTATIKWYAKLVNVNRLTGATITDVCNLTLQFNQGSKWFYDVEKDMYGIVLKLSEAVPNGTVVTNNAKKRTINTMEAIQVGQEFVKRVNDYLFEAKANNTKLKSTGTPFELTKKNGATSGSGNSTAKKPAGRK